MDYPDTLFRYFRAPRQFSTYNAEGRSCDLCGKIGPGYAGNFTGVADVEYVCESCLSTGALANKEVSSNEADVEALRVQLAHAHPDQEREQIEDWVRERTAEVEQRTPTLVMWQDFFWPAHCGDYCCFLKEVGKPDLNRLAPNHDGQAFFEAHLLDAGKTDVNSVWQGCREDSPEDNSVPHDVGVYLFSCLNCGHHVILWDGS